MAARNKSESKDVTLREIQSVETLQDKPVNVFLGLFVVENIRDFRDGFLKDSEVRMCHLGASDPVGLVAAVPFDLSKSKMVEIGGIIGFGDHCS